MAKHTNIQNPTSLEIESIQSFYHIDFSSNYDTIKWIWFSRETL